MIIVVGNSNTCVSLGVSVDVYIYVVPAYLLFSVNYCAKHQSIPQGVRVK